MARHRETISLVDDQGQEHEFDLVDVIEVAQQRYAILQPAGGETDAVIFRMEDDETLAAVDDDEEFARVAAALEDMEDGESADADEDDDEDDDDDDEDDDEDGEEG
ncbi:MAG: DUF1292 domain-containing protein [bacterium]